MKRENISLLRTEQANRAAQDLDLRSSIEIAEIINREDQKVALAVSRVLPQIARAIDWIAEAIRRGGRLIYVGTGTSGRIGALDASECPPTFGIRPETVRFVIAGGERALAHATEASEDSRENGQQDMAKLRPNKKDVVVGIAASGRTPYTIAAIQYARSRGAKTVAVVCNQNSPLQRAASLGIVVQVGPEVVAGSSRMKAGTAQKMVLNMLSTGAMARVGYVFGNQMVNVHTKNSKLVERGIGILQKLTGSKREEAISALEQARGDVPVALISIQTGTTASVARKLLAAERGNVRRALQRAMKNSSKAYAASAGSGKALTIRKRRNG